MSGRELQLAIEFKSKPLFPVPTVNHSESGLCNKSADK